MGRDLILKAPTTSEPGVAVLQGEVVTIAPLKITLKNNTNYDLKVEEWVEDVTTSEDVYKSARVVRTAYLTEGFGFQTNSRGELEEQGLNIQGISTLFESLQRKLDKATIYTDSISYAPLFIEDISEIQDNLNQCAIISTFPNVYAGEQGSDAPFVNNQEEALGATLKTSLVHLGGNPKYPSFRQELTTPDGVVYERYVFDERAYDITSTSYGFIHPALKNNIPWRANPGSVIGTLTLTPGGRWVKTGVFRYGSFVNRGGDVTITDCHKLLAPDKCQIQASASPDVVTERRDVRVVWTMNRDKSPGFRFRVIDSANAIDKAFVSITAIALPVNDPWSLDYTAEDFEI